MSADRINAGNLQTEGLQETQGEAAGREKGHSQSRHPSPPAHGGVADGTPGAHSSTRDFLEKELHRRNSKRELHHNKGSVPYLKSQSCVVVFQNEK